MTAAFDPKRIAFVGADFGDLERRLMAHLALHHRPFDYKDLAVACLGPAYGMSPRKIQKNPALAAPYGLHEYQLQAYRALFAKPTKSELAFRQTLNETWRQIGKQETRFAATFSHDFEDVEYDGTTMQPLRRVFGDLKTGRFWEAPLPRPSRPLSPTLAKVAQSLSPTYRWRI